MKIELDEKSVMMIVSMLTYIDPTGFMFRKLVDELQAQIKKESVQIVQK